MAEDFDHTTDTTFTAFIPLTILLVGFIIWFSVQDFQQNAQRGNLVNAFNQAKQTLLEDQNYNQRYLSLIQDLDKTAQSDDTAKAILADALKGGLISDAVRVGLIHVQQNPAPGSK